MITPEDLQRRLEKCLAEGGFTPRELALRHARALARDGGGDARAEADRLLAEAGFEITAGELVGLAEEKPWLVDAVIRLDGRGPGDRH